ncbi:cobalamin-dependent protein [Actinomadura yumaensis]|uniref:cobalamin B12-binding domain-containing protein n=1 Tax=Actinomadura TaxID=1988 RepID=UPI0019D5D289|nr:cobalamin B12-binding domain-containing protein [Actinomadura sp. J1-007]
MRTAVVTSTPSDSHTWGLVVLQCVLEEAGYAVRNLGACTPVARVLDECRAVRPDLLAVSTVNGHGRVEGAELITALRGDPDLAGLPAVIGGCSRPAAPTPARSGRN